MTVLLLFYIENLADDEFDTPTPCDDDEANGISHHMKFHSLPKKTNNYSPSESDQNNRLKKYNTANINV